MDACDVQTLIFMVRTFISPLVSFFSHIVLLRSVYALSHAFFSPMVNTGRVGVRCWLQ
jgi:hypothetical protein